MRPRNAIRTATGIFLLLVSCVWALALAGATSDGEDPPEYSAWSTPVNLGPPVNTTLPEFQPFITKDGLSLYFARLDGPLATDPQDIWVAKRNSKTDPWGIPQRLGPAINTPATEALPFVTIDGHWMYFVSFARPGGFGRNDIYVSRRHNKREDFPTEPSGGWQEAVNLGPNVNTSSGEQAPFVFEDEETGVTTLYFNSNRFANQHDIYASTLQPDGTFGPAAPVAELNTPSSNDQHPMLSREGLQMFFISNRPGSTIGSDGFFSPDIWVSTRASTSDPWGMPENLDTVNARLGGGPINNMFFEERPALSFDGTVLYFTNGGRPENLGGQGFFDIWVSTRNKLRNGHDHDRDRDDDEGGRSHSRQYRD